MRLLNERNLTEIMDEVEYHIITQDEGLDKFISFLYDVQFRGKLYLDDRKRIVFIHDLNVSDFMSKGGNWFIKIPDSMEFSESTKISYIQSQLEEDNRVIQFLINEFNYGIVVSEQRELFWLKYVLKKKSKLILANLDIHTRKYYGLISTLRSSLAYSWCLAPGKGSEYVEYLKKSVKNAISHNDLQR